MYKQIINVYTKYPVTFTNTRDEIINKLRELKIVETVLIKETNAPITKNDKKLLEK